MQKVSTILFQLLIVTILSFSAKASECYHYHTKKSYKVVQNNGKYFLQFTVKNPDGITFVSQENYLIGNVKTAISIVAQDDVREPILSDGSSTLWIYFKDGISLTNNTDVNFMTINASFVNIDRTVMLSAGKYYTNGWATANQVEPVDLTAVKDKLSLVELADGNYADNYFNYQLINNKLVTGQSVKKQVQGYPTIASYGTYTSAIVVEKGMLYWNENKTTKINSAIKA